MSFNSRLLLGHLVLKTASYWYLVPRVGVSFGLGDHCGFDRTKAGLQIAYAQELSAKHIERTEIRNLVV